ncbi:hypothetical protein C0584_04820, partial [Candidatus Parcubacteria bacterium]
MYTKKVIAVLTILSFALYGPFVPLHFGGIPAQASEISSEESSSTVEQTISVESSSSTEEEQSSDLPDKSHETNDEKPSKENEQNSTEEVEIQTVAINEEQESESVSLESSEPSTQEEASTEDPKLNLSESSDTEIPPEEEEVTEEDSSNLDSSLEETEAVVSENTEETQTLESSQSSSYSAPVELQETSVAIVQDPELSTDKADYHPGETATIFGRFFSSIQNILLTIFGYGPDGNDYTESTQEVTTDEEGSFETTYTLDEVYRPIYTVQANSTDGALLAETTFTDTPATSVTLMGYKIPVGGSFNPGWTTGNLDKSYDEGEWVPYQLVINNVQTEYPNLASFPDIGLEFDFTDSGGARFVDLVRSVQLGNVELNDDQGFPDEDGNAFILNSLSDANPAQNHPDEEEWDLDNYTLVNTLTGWDPTTQVNIPVVGSAPGTVTDLDHQFYITGAQIQEWASSTGNLLTDTIVVYFQLHESRTFVWEHALQGGYDQAPTDDWGGWLYDNPPYTSDSRLGSGFVPGSSGHVTTQITGIGEKTVPIPIPPSPPGLIDGYKFEGSLDGPGIENWQIHILAKVEGGIIFDTHVATDINGYYSFPSLTAGTWYVGEHLGPGSPHEDGWEQTYPDSTIFISPGATSSLVADFPTDVMNEITPIHLAEWGWTVDLSLDQPEQHDINFANFFGTPNTLLDISVSSSTVYAGDTVDLTITEENTGDVKLNNPYVDVFDGSATTTLNKASASFVDGDDNDDGILDPEETWQWIITGVVVNSDTSYTATGHGTDALGGDVT